MHPFVRVTAGLALGAVLVGCGSTVPVAQRVTGAGDGLGGGPAAAGGSTGGDLAGPGSVAAGTSGYLPGTTGTTGGDVAVPSAGPALPGTNDLSGVVGGTKPIYVG